MLFCMWAVETAVLGRACPARRACCSFCSTCAHMSCEVHTATCTYSACADSTQRGPRSVQALAPLWERRARARVDQKHGAGVHCCKGDSACRVRVCTCLRARMCACTFLCVRVYVPASVRACICTPEHAHEVYQAFWPACTHICAINRVQMYRNQRVRFYPAAHDRLYPAVISGGYNR